MRKYTPKDATRRLTSKEVIEFACDVVCNGAFAKADARTLDAHGLRIADQVGTPEERKRWPARLHQILSLPVGQFQQAMALEPVRLSKVQKPNGGSRDIVVPTFLRRCVSNAINETLTRTGDHMLPDCVRAYRPGDQNGVQEAILDVAEAVRDGRVRYFCKLDFKSYFSQMPWESIEEALRHYGYDNDFIERVMAVVQCRIVKREFGRLVPVITCKGAQQGLAESSTLANMVPWELDRDLEARATLHYERYSDDLFVGSRDRGEVVAAVRLVAQWCRRNGLTLKGAESNTRLAGLVQDVKKTKVEFLGAEIDQHGYVHMPAPKLHDKVAELERMYSLLVLGLVHGVSRYGDGGGAEAFDEDDLRRSMAAFLDYWSGLDPRGTERARLTFKRRIPLTPGSSELGQGAVWCARLWGHQTNREGGTTPTVLDPMLMLSEGTTPTPSRRSPSATGETAWGALCRDSSPQEESERSDDTASEPGPLSNAPPVAPATLSLDGAAHVDAFTCVDAPTSSFEEGTSGRLDEEALPSDADGHETYRFETRSLEVEDSWLADLDQDQTSQDLHHSEGAQGDPAGGASPPRPVIENCPTFYVHAVSAWVGRDRVVLVSQCVTVDGLAYGATVRVVRDCRAEAALVNEMRRLLRAFTGAITLQMQDSWLAKSLLQPHRRFRAPLLFTRILELHQTARSRDVTVAGGMPVPTALARAMDRVLDQLVRAAA